MAEVFENAVDDSPEDHAVRAISLAPTPLPTIHLKTLDDVRVEMAKVYRGMKTRKIDTQDGTRLTYVLAQIGKLIESSKLADRIEALERALGSRPRP
jgi:hypothetical protein